MKILFFCPQPIWPANTGARLRNFHLATALAKVFDVSVLQLHNEDECPVPLTGPNPFAQIVSSPRGGGYTPVKIIRGVVGPMPIPTLNYYSGTAAEQLSDLLASDQFDAVQMESVHLFQYLPVLRRVAENCALLVDWHNIESNLMSQYAETAASIPRKLVARRTAYLLARTENRLLGLAKVHSVVSQQEKEALQDRCPTARIEVVPNGVDTRYFGPGGTRRQGDKLVFVGSMDYHANIDAVTWFVREVWPKIAAEHQDVRFVVAGRNPARAVRELASDRVIVTGTLEDVRPVYADALAMVVPLRVGGGTRLKILEAMSSGVPVISTKLGAEGIDAVDGTHLLLADSPPEMTSALQRIRSDWQLRERLVSSALRLVADSYDWAAVGSRLVSIYKSMDQGRTSA